MKVPPGQFHPPHKTQPGQTCLRSLDHCREVEELQLEVVIPPGDFCEKRTFTTTHIQHHLATRQRIPIEDVLGQRQHRLRHQGAVVGHIPAPELLGMRDARVREVTVDRPPIARLSKELHRIRQIPIQQRVVLDHPREARVADQRRPHRATAEPPPRPPLHQPQRRRRPQQPLRLLHRHTDVRRDLLSRPRSHREEIEQPHPHTCRQGLRVDEPRRQVEHRPGPSQRDRPHQRERRRPPLELRTRLDRVPPREHPIPPRHRHLIARHRHPCER